MLVVSKAGLGKQSDQFQSQESFEEEETEDSVFTRRWRVEISCSTARRWEAKALACSSALARLCATDERARHKQKRRDTRIREAARLARRKDGSASFDRKTQGVLRVDTKTRQRKDDKKQQKQQK